MLKCCDEQYAGKCRLMVVWDLYPGLSSDAIDKNILSAPVLAGAIFVYNSCKVPPFDILIWDKC